MSTFRPGRKWVEVSPNRVALDQEAVRYNTATNTRAWVRRSRPVSTAVFDGVCEWLILGYALAFGVAGAGISAFLFHNDWVRRGTIFVVALVMTVVLKAQLVKRIEARGKARS